MTNLTFLALKSCFSLNMIIFTIITKFMFSIRLNKPFCFQGFKDFFFLFFYFLPFSFAIQTHAKLMFTITFLQTSFTIVAVKELLLQTNNAFIAFLTIENILCKLWMNLFTLITFHHYTII